MIHSVDGGKVAIAANFTAEPKSEKEGTAKWRGDVTAVELGRRGSA